MATKVKMLVDTFHPEAGGSVRVDQEVTIPNTLADWWDKAGIATVIEEVGPDAERDTRRSEPTRQPVDQARNALPPPPPAVPATFSCPVPGCDHTPFRTESAQKGHVTREHPEAASAPQAPTTGTPGQAGPNDPGNADGSGKYDAAITREQAQPLTPEK